MSPQHPPSFSKAEVIVHPIEFTGDVGGVALALSLLTSNFKVSSNIYGVLIVSKKDKMEDAKQLKIFYETLCQLCSKNSTRPIYIELLEIIEDWNYSNFTSRLTQKVHADKFASIYGMFPDFKQVDISFVALGHSQALVKEWLQKSFSRDLALQNLQMIFRKNTLRSALKLMRFPPRPNNNEIELKKNAASRPDFLTPFQYQVNQNTLFMWVRHSGRTGVHQELDTSNTVLRYLAQFLVDNPQMANNYSQIVLIGDKPNRENQVDIKKETAPVISFMQETFRETPYHFVNMVEWWKKEPFEGKYRLCQIGFWNYIYDIQFSENRKNILHIGMRSGQLELMAYLGFFVNYIDHSTSKIPEEIPSDVNRIASLADQMFNFQHYLCPPLTSKAQCFFNQLEFRHPRELQYFKLVSDLLGNPAFQNDSLTIFIHQVKYESGETLNKVVGQFIRHTARPYKCLLDAETPQYNFGIKEDTLESTLRRNYPMSSEEDRKKLLQSCGEKNTIMGRLVSCLYAHDLKDLFPSQPLTNKQIILLLTLKSHLAGDAFSQFYTDSYVKVQNLPQQHQPIIFNNIAPPAPLAVQFSCPLLNLPKPPKTQLDTTNSISKNSVLDFN